MNNTLRNDLRELVLKGTCNAKTVDKSVSANLAKYNKLQDTGDCPMHGLQGLACTQLNSTLTSLINNGVMTGEQAYKVLDTFGRVYDITLRGFFEHCTETHGKHHIIPISRIGRLIHEGRLDWTFQVYNNIEGIDTQLDCSPDSYLDLLVSTILGELQDESFDTTANVHINFAGGLAENPNNADVVFNFKLALYLSAHVVKSVYPNCKVVFSYLTQDEYNAALDKKATTELALDKYTALKKTSKPISAYIQTEPEYTQFDRNMIDYIQRGVMSAESAFEAFKVFHEVSDRAYKECSRIDSPDTANRCVLPLVRLSRTADRTTVFAHNFNGLDIPDYIEYGTPEYWERFNIWRDYDELPNTSLYTSQQIALFVESALIQLQGSNPADSRQLYIDIVGLASAYTADSKGLSNLYNAVRAAFEIVQAVYPNCYLTPKVKYTGY